MARQARVPMGGGGMFASLASARLPPE